MILYKEEETSTDYKIIQITRHRFFRIRFRFFPQKKGEKKKKEAMTPPLFFRPRQTTKRSNNDNK